MLLEFKLKQLGRWRERKKEDKPNCLIPKPQFTMGNDGMVYGMGTCCPFDAVFCPFLQRWANNSKYAA